MTLQVHTTPAHASRQYHAVPALIPASGDRAGTRFLEFFARQIIIPMHVMPHRQFESTIRKAIAAALLMFFGIDDGGKHELPNPWLASRTICQTV